MTRLASWLALALSAVTAGVVAFDLERRRRTEQCSPGGPESKCAGWCPCGGGL